MFIVRYEKLDGQSKEFYFDDRVLAEAFAEGIKSLKNTLNIISLEIIEKEG